MGACVSKKEGSRQPQEQIRKSEGTLPPTAASNDIHRDSTHPKQINLRSVDRSQNLSECNPDANSDGLPEKLPELSNITKNKK